jgi:hypothetical protein
MLGLVLLADFLPEPLPSGSRACYNNSHHTGFGGKVL